MDVGANYRQITFRGGTCMYIYWGTLYSKTCLLRTQTQGNLGDDQEVICFSHIP